MSFLAGSVAGALVSGGVYYGFSSLMQSKTAHLRADLHLLSERLVTASTIVPPPPASTRIVHRPFLTLVQSRWNQEVASIFATLTRWEQHASEWGRKRLYGERS
ncbi:hypothetical protein EDC04DRAFT_228057 [Pisolithus marmoratus]|nr:hypothetical protein EDC04DRAFT_228057 [Pisolithus marmoratus]